MKNLFEKFLNEAESILKGVDFKDDRKNSAVYKFNGLSKEEVEKKMIYCLNYWYFVANLISYEDYSIKFDIDGTEFVFTWDKEKKELYSIDENGNRFVYDAPNKQLVVTLNAKENEHAPEIEDGNKESEDEIEVKEKEYELDCDNKNFAKALKDAIVKKSEKNDEDCGCEFCPYDAIFYLRDILEYGDFDIISDDDDVHGVMVSFSSLCDYINPEYLYHKESDDLDEFCELAKEKYGFSSASWDFVKDDNICDILFTFVF